MSFFGKLKTKLFKSSSKLDEGLDAIVSEGAQETPEPEIPPAPAPDPKPDPGPGPDISPPSEPDPVSEPPDAPVTPPAPEEVPEPDLPPQPVRPPKRDVPNQPDPQPSEPPREAPQPDDPVPSSPPEAPPAPPTEVPPPSAPPGGPVTLKDSPVRQETKPSLLDRLLKRDSAPSEIRRELDDDMLEQLEELLIQADMGVDTALRVTANIAEGRFGKKLSAREIKEILAAEVARIMEPVARPLPLYPSKPQVVLVVGVNGSGKTTTIGKLASQFHAAGKNVVIAAGDTFRAAAVEQLQVWGERAGVPVLTAPEGSDPASLAFDALTRAQADGADLLMIDTAGRLQNRADLMEELAKIVRVIRKKDPSAPHNTLLVLDATTGQNALSQVETFRKLADVSGLVMTKLDGTARGGVLVALADKFGLPIHAIGVGEQIDDLQPFDPKEFAAALTGIAA
ncbi:signal recognition particle-docking protein FtsY [Marivita sp. GX14005]|uniref:signal recognition particle-docking protein FtsY n=1 Tax=Marivita sp. GX14005 TaxID=2942276 RepID=UPI002019F840|nr:signal recognition particle-docking protein FtsY [Marivita sp. GX14005]MCL3882293.1 signal recognition particle-docking protein FtsY [Marivita sp. GX14005]